MTRTGRDYWADVTDIVPERRAALEGFARDEDGVTVVPLVCDDCGRPTFYDYADEAYHHALDPARGCFLIPEDPAARADAAHPMIATVLDMVTLDAVANLSELGDDTRAAADAVDPSGGPVAAALIDLADDLRRYLADRVAGAVDEWNAAHQPESVF